MAYASCAFQLLHRHIEVTLPDLDVEAVRRALTGRTIGCRILHYPSLDSTMNEAARLAAEGCPEGTVVLAEEQAAGRGRFSRSWISGPGESLLLSIVLRPTTEQLPQANMAATLAVAGTADRHVDGRVTIKWPNDVRIGGRKVAGILIESDTQAGRGAVAVVGIGLNISVDTAAHPEIADTATSIAEKAGAPVERTEVLAALLRRFDDLYARVRSGQSLTDDWSSRLDTLGLDVKVRRGDEVLSGTARKVDDQGNLVLERPDGSTVTIVGGEVTLQA